MSLFFNCDMTALGLINYTVPQSGRKLLLVFSGLGPRSSEGGGESDLPTLPHEIKNTTERCDFLIWLRKSDAPSSGASEEMV